MIDNLNYQLKTVVQRMQSGNITFQEGVAAFKREWLLQAFELNHGNNCRTARGLGLHRNTLSRIVDGLKLEPVVREMRRKRAGR